MNEDNYDKLFEKHPKIFLSEDKVPNLPFGIECGPGWYNLIDHLCLSLQHLYETSVLIDNVYQLVEPPQVIAHQVKEKFGTLRFYYHLKFCNKYEELLKTCSDNKHIEELNNYACGYQSYIEGIVHMAETISAHTCEYSGKPGIMHRTPGGWYKVLNEEVATSVEKYSRRGYMPLNTFKEDV